MTECGTEQDGNAKPKVAKHEYQHNKVCQQDLQQVEKGGQYVTEGEHLGHRWNNFASTN